MALEPQDYDLDWLQPGKTVYRIGYTRAGVASIHTLTVDRLTKTLAILKGKSGEYRYNRTYNSQSHIRGPAHLLEYRSGWNSSSSRVVPEGHPLLESAKVEMVNRKAKQAVDDAVFALRKGFDVENVTALRAAADAWLKAHADTDPTITT